MIIFWFYDHVINNVTTQTFLLIAYANLDFGVTHRRSDLSALAYNAYAGLEKVTKLLLSYSNFRIFNERTELFDFINYFISRYVDLCMASLRKIKVLCYSGVYYLVYLWQIIKDLLVFHPKDLELSENMPFISSSILWPT